MASRPSQDFVWAASGTKVDPGAPKKDAGFLVQERPPFTWLNYLFNLIAQWIAYLRDRNEQWRIERHFVWGPVGTTWAASQSLRQLLPTQVGLTSGTNTSGAILAPGVPTDPAPHTSLRLRHLNASTNADILVHQDDSAGTSFLTIADLDTLEFEMEWRSYLTAVGTNELDVVMGMHSAPTAASVDDHTTQSFFTFRKLSADTNWQARVGDAATGATSDTGAAPVANTWQRFRIEYYGSSTLIGVANSNVPVVRFYIDGALVAENITGEAPSGSTGLGLMIRFDSTATGPSGDQDMIIGPMRLTWNPVAVD